MRTGILLPAVFALAAGICQAQLTTYRDFHDFGGTTRNTAGVIGLDGAQPQGSVAFDSSGNMFGTATRQGPNSFGIVWEIAAAGGYKDLHDFGGTIMDSNGSIGFDGARPVAGVTVDANGDLFGTTQGGGYFGAGMVWEITKAGVYIDLHDFGGEISPAAGKSIADGASPLAGVTIDSMGNIYGTTCSGGAYGYYGVVWELTASRVYRDVHDFGGTVTNVGGKLGPDGANPACAVTIDRSGNLFGTTRAGGANANAALSGIVWSISVDGAYEDLHDFGSSATNANGVTGPDGGDPEWPVALDSSGNLFGTANLGGPATTYPGGAGIVWRLSRSGVYQDLHDFGGMTTIASGGSGPDGILPSGLVLDALGNIYGTTYHGGPSDPAHNGSGILWEITAGGVYRDLHDFGGSVINANGSLGSDGAETFGMVSLDPGGNLYGITSMGGPVATSGGGGGVVWVLTGALKGIALAPAVLFGGNNSTGTITLTNPAPTGGVRFALSSSLSSASVPTSLTIPAGRSSISFAIKTATVPTKVIAAIQAADGKTARSTGLTIKPPLPQH